MIEVNRMRGAEMVTGATGDQAIRVRGARRVFRKFTPRAVAFDRPAGGLAGVLERSGSADRVLLVGARPGGSSAGFTAWADSVPEGWDVDPEGHYLEGDYPTLRYVSPDGRRVSVHRAAQWYGDDALDATPDQAARAWAELEEGVRRHFDPGAQLLTSPATTGRELWLRSIPRGAVWEPMPDELQSICRRTSTQGRVELLPRARGELEGLVGLDGRFMYAALCWGLPSGPAELRRVSEYLGQTRARYHANATVPRDWSVRCACGAPGHAGIGLLPVPGARRRDGWSYPSDPGETMVGWWDGAELAVALAHGWRVEPFEAVVWSGEGNTEPLDGWAKRLVGARESLARQTRRTATGPGLELEVGRMAAAGVRSILLHAVGAFHGSTHRVTRSCSVDHPEEVPATALELRHEGDRIVWAEHQAPAWAELAHPEWSTAIWARARARLLSGPRATGALHVPAGDVIAFRTDALYLEHAPRWDDDGKVGRLRIVREVPGPLPTPRTHAELLAAAR